jgi:hypothetical protein
MKKIIFIFLFCSIFFTFYTNVFGDGTEYMAVFGSEEGTDYWNYVSDIPLNSAPKYQDVQNFSNIFEERGWENVLTSYQAQRENICGGEDEVDLLYWSGHGLINGIMSYYNDTEYVSYTESDFRGFDEVGDDIVSYDSDNGYITNSNWNSDMEWAILATCNQFSTSALCRAWGSFTWLP